jgi:hypothetical protein
VGGTWKKKNKKRKTKWHSIRRSLITRRKIKTLSLLSTDTTASDYPMPLQSEDTATH